MQSRWKRPPSVRYLWFLLSPNAPPPFTRAASGLMDILSKHQTKKSESPPPGAEKPSGVGVFAELARRRPLEPVPEPTQPYPQSLANSVHAPRLVPDQPPTPSHQLPPRPIPRDPAPHLTTATNSRKPVWRERKADSKITRSSLISGLNGVNGVYDGRWMNLLRNRPLNGINGDQKSKPTVSKPPIPQKKQQKTITISDDITAKLLAHKLGNQAMPSIDADDRMQGSLLVRWSVHCHHWERHPSHLKIRKTANHQNAVHCCLCRLSLDAAELAALEFDAVVQKTKSKRTQASSSIPRESGCGCRHLLWGDCVSITSGHCYGPC